MDQTTDVAYIPKSIDKEGVGRQLPCDGMEALALGAVLLERVIRAVRCSLCASSRPLDKPHY